MVTLNDALMDLVTKKLITPEEGYAKAIDKAGMETDDEAGRVRPVEAGGRGAPPGRRVPARPPGAPPAAGPGRRPARPEPFRPVARFENPVLYSSGSVGARTTLSSPAAFEGGPRGSQGVPDQQHGRGQTIRRDQLTC